jgi:hypothetical protein
MAEKIISLSGAGENFISFREKEVNRKLELVPSLMFFSVKKQACGREGRG